jgi:hypothetical protein
MATAPLYGDPAANAPVWSKYAVLLGSLTATVPVGNAAFTLNDPGAGTPVTNEWDPVGALDSDSPFDDGDESIDSNDHTAAGIGVYATTHKNQKETRTFTAKETTLVTLGLVYDASGVTDTAGTLQGTLARRDPTKKYLIAFHRENSTDCERYISVKWATIDSISRSFGNDESLRSVTVTIAPDTSVDPADMYHYYKGPKA